MDLSHLWNSVARREPEFEWNNQEVINHSHDAILAMQSMGKFFGMGSNNRTLPPLPFFLPLTVCAELYI